MSESRDGSDGRRRVRVHTWFGDMIITANENAVCAIQSASAEDGTVPNYVADELLMRAAQQMQEYFEGKRIEFTFPMEPQGTAFQRAVWDKLREIPCGVTATYGQIAAAVGNPKAARAVGTACNRNPIWIAVPCHRVVGSDGALVGYAQGIDMKRALLELEARHKEK